MKYLVISALLGAGVFPLLPGFREESAWTNRARNFWSAYALAHVVFVLWLFGNHLSFPFNLETMESTVLQAVMRVEAGLPVYAPPTPEYVPLAYNPLFYLVALPFVKLAGPTLAAIRLPAILGSLASAFLIYRILRDRSVTRWWSAMAVGIFAAAYRAMDCYLDVGHRDSLMLAAVLAGFHWLNRADGAWRIAGMCSLACAFWLKQQGGGFLIAGAVYLLIRYGIRGAWIAAGAGAALGPALYAFAPASWFGAEMHYYTWAVPRQWSEFTTAEYLNLATLVVRTYGPLAVTAAVGAFALAKERALGQLGSWAVAVLAGIASAPAAAMTPGSNNNIYIPMFVMMLLAAVLTLSRYSIDLRRQRIAFCALAMVFAALVYDPRSVIRKPVEAATAYADLRHVVTKLGGPVYGPAFGPVGSPNALFQPAAHWVPLEDLVRGPGRNEQADVRVHNLLRAVEQPEGRSFVLTHSPVERDSLLGFLASRYTLQQDLGERFQPLAALPARFGGATPRYLYRFEPYSLVPWTSAKHGENLP